MARVRSWSHWSPTSQVFWRSSISPTRPCSLTSLSAVGAALHEQKLSAQTQLLFLKLHPPLLNTLLLSGSPPWLMFIFPQPWTCQLHLQRQHLFRESAIFYLIWWLCCENATVTQLKMSQELGYLDRFERSTSACAWGTCPMPLCVNGYGLFQKKTPQPKTRRTKSRQM